MIELHFSTIIINKNKTRCKGKEITCLFILNPIIVVFENVSRNMSLNLEERKL